MKARLLLETIEDVERIYKEYLNNSEYRRKIINSAFKLGYVIHGTNANFDKFDKSHVKGGHRANYGHGFYFTNNITKYEEYGSDPSKFKFCDVSNMELINLHNSPASIGLIPTQERLNDLKTQVYKIDDELDNTRSNKEYYDLSSIKDEIEDEIKLLSSSMTRYDEYVDNFIYKNKNEDFETLNKRILSSVPNNIEEQLSEYYAKKGFDGFVIDYEYVIFNYDKLNENLVVDIKTFVYRLSQHVGTIQENELYEAKKKSTKKSFNDLKSEMTYLSNSIGFHEPTQKWYGWSHRAYYGFGVGSKVKKGDTSFHIRGGWTAKNLDDAKQMAMDFSRAVS